MSFSNKKTRHSRIAPQAIAAAQNASRLARSLIGGAGLEEIPAAYGVAKKTRPSMKSGSFAESGRGRLAIIHEVSIAAARELNRRALAVPVHIPELVSFWHLQGHTCSRVRGTTLDLRASPES